MENEKQGEEFKDDGVKSEDNGQHTLGLHDLYRAAFSEEYIRKPEHETYEIYAMKPLSYTDDDNQACFNDTATPPTYEAFDSKYSSVLDLDKGVTVQTMQEDPEGPVATYVCDGQILQRYLHDASISLYKEDSNGQAVFTPKPVLIDDGEGLGIAPEKLGVKYSDCDFNSSDSFASTESIIPKTIKCPLCPKTFMFKADLTRHKKHKHSSNNCANPSSKFVCKLCHKSFVCQQNLTVHERHHNTKPDLKCHACKQGFRSNKQFAVHMETIHDERTPFHCPQPLCPRAYRKGADLANHLKKFHKVFELSNLPTPEQSDEKNITSTPHKKQQGVSYVCAICMKQYKTQRALSNHAKKHVVVILKDGSGNELPARPTANQLPTLKTGIRLDSLPTSKASLVGVINPASKESLVRVKNPARPNHNKKIQRGKFTCPECSEKFPTRKAMGLHITEEHIKTQETCTQTELFDLQNVDIPIIMDAEGATVQPIIITPSSNYSSMPLIISHHSFATVPYSSS